MDVAFGMEYLHGKNIVHFDLKSDNLLVNLRDLHRPICKVSDWSGVAFKMVLFAAKLLLFQSAFSDLVTCFNYCCSREQSAFSDHNKTESHKKKKKTVHLSASDVRLGIWAYQR